MPKRVGVMIQNPEVWDAFRTFVYRKWGKKHTVMAIELEKALIEYMRKEDKSLSKPSEQKTIPLTRWRERQTDGSSYANAQKSSDKASKTMRTLNNIKEELTKSYTVQASQYDIEKIIREHAGGDPKTLNKYMTLLQEYNIISPDRPILNTNKFIFRVNGFETNKD